MNVYLFSFTREASRLSLKLRKHFEEQKIACTSFTMDKYADCMGLTPLTKSLKEHVADCFLQENALIFISACGIAVRSIAPFIQKKTTDPCVLVVDEKANFVVSLLSGHIGGGNEFTLKVADVLEATPVISTATDLNEKFAVDTFAKKNGLVLSDMKLAKKVSSSLLDKVPVGIAGIVPKGTIPEGIVKASLCSEVTSKPKLGICIRAFSEPNPFEDTLYLIPKQVVLGIGCRRNTEYERLKDFVEATLYKYHIHPMAVAAITSIDLKKDEDGLIQLAEQYQVPFVTYDRDTLLSVPGEFSASSFVKSVTGVDNVCERATLAYSKAEKLFLPKTAYEGMTIAISLLDVELHF